MAAPPLIQRVEIDTSRAQSQIAALERQIATLSQPVNIPVDIEADQSLDQLRLDLDRVDNETVDVNVDVDGVSQADAAFDDLNRELDQTDTALRQVGDEADRTGRDLEDAGTRGAGALRGLGGSIVAFGGALAAFQGFRLLISGAGAAIDAASNFQESISKANVVFGDFASDVEDFASTGPEALGLSTAAALEATATFGNLFIALGLSQEAAATLAPDIVQLASDLASFNNIEVAEAVEKLRAGLVGEAEPLRTLGVNINEALTTAKATQLGLVDANGAVTEAGKVQARYALILEQTSTAQGDYARTADGIANTQRTLKAEFEDVAAEVGEALLPAYEALLDLAPAVLTSIEDLTPVIAALSTSFADSAPNVSQFGEAIQVLLEVGPAVGVLTEAGLGLAEAFLGLMSFNPQALVAGIDDIGNAIDDFNLEALEQGLVNALQAGVDPAVALANSLVELSDLGLDTDQIAAAAAALTTLSGVDISRMGDVADTLRAQGEAAGLDAAEIDALVRGIFGLLSAGAAASSASASRGAAGRRSAAENKRNAEEAAAAAEKAAAAAMSEAEALDILQAAADETGTTIGGVLLPGIKELPPELAAVAAVLDESTIAFLTNMEAIDQLQEPIGALPGTMETAAAALKTTEGEIVTDFDTFLSQLEAQLEARQAFETNLAILRALGLDDLANVFDDAGLPSAQALADAIASPEKLDEAAALLAGDFGTTGTDLMAIISAAVEDDDQTKQALIQNLITAANAADDPAVRAALTALAEDLTITIPVVMGPITGAPVEARVSNPPPITGGTQVLPTSSEPTITQNFYSEPNPSPASQQAAQQAKAILG